MPKRRNRYDLRPYSLRTSDCPNRPEAEVYLFFDYDGHQNNLSEDDDSDVLEQMLESFDSCKC